MKISEKLIDESGDSFVYKIENTKNGRCYIGSSCNVVKRIESHLNQLRKNKHSSKLMQDDFNSDGEGFFTWEVVRRFRDLDEAKISEGQFLKILNPDYNGNGRILRATFNEVDIILNKIDSLEKKVKDIQLFLNERMSANKHELYPKFDVEKLRKRTKGKLKPAAKLHGVTYAHVRRVARGQVKDVRIINYLLTISDNDRKEKATTL